MHQSLLFFLCLPAASLAIIGGELASAGLFPWQAALFVTTVDSQHFCSGGLVSNQWLITSASCITNVKVIEVHLGTLSSDSTTVDSSRRIVAAYDVINHPDFNPESVSDDVGLIKLTLPVTLTQYILPIQLLSIHVEEGQHTQLAGWGQTSDSVSGHVDTLYYVNLYTISNVECQVTYGNNIVTDAKICAAGNLYEGSCTGDTGAPLTGYDQLGRPFLVGFSSFISSRGCETPDPTGFTRTETYLNWIQGSMSTKF